MADFVPIPDAVLETWVGKKLHLSRSYTGTVWKLIGLQGNWMLLETPSTRRKMKALRTRAQYLRQDEPQSKE
jgi:hypothetical protein